jgi:outer membrane biosynthesis protein TonB
MKEKSQLEDMRAALQGDLERARERRGETLLDPEPEPQADVSDTPDEAPEVIVQVSDTPEPEPAVEPEPEPELEPTPRRRFLWFLRD